MTFGRDEITGNMFHAIPSTTLRMIDIQIIDHLVYATPDVDESVRDLAARFGVHASAGGSHAGKGTRNALLALGPRCYLEIVGPDAYQQPPDKPRWFGIDTLTSPRLMTWAAATTALDDVLERTHTSGIPLGAIASGSRVRPDGISLSWRYTDPYTVIADGVIPFFIDWNSSPHPADTAAQGLVLRDMHVVHPHAEFVRQAFHAMQLDIAVHGGNEPAIVAIIEGPNGPLELR